MPSPARAAIFDLDGTLLDTLDDLAGAANTMLAESGFPTHPESAYVDFIGNGMAMLVTRALPEGARDPEIVARCTDRYRELYQEGWHNRTVPYPGVPELLRSLSEEGWALGVVSNKPHHFTDLCISHFFPGQFDCVLGQRDEVPRKPDPAGLLEAAVLLGTETRNCVYIGDSGVDVETALRAEITCIAVLWGFRDRDELASAGATHFAENVPALGEKIRQTVRP